MKAEMQLCGLFAVVATVVPITHGQGQQCVQPSDCTSEYAPYCSKWGWCVWTSLYGDQGPPQSYGAEEDGVRGQCRSDNDCTRWASKCSPLGYCRGGSWDGSFGSRSNPRPGQEPSKWIKNQLGAKSAGGTSRATTNSVRPAPSIGSPRRPGLKSGKTPSTAAVGRTSNNSKRPGSTRNKIGGKKTGGRENTVLLGNTHKRRPNNNSNRMSGGQGMSSCPGSLEACMEVCPSRINVFQACARSCARRCH